MKTIIVVLLTLVFYCYFVYPLLIGIIAKLRPKPFKVIDHFPTVSIVISVYNEEDVIARKINNLLSLDYPPEKMEILIGSDGSTDRTNTIIKSFCDPRIHLLAHHQRRGKPATISELVGVSRHELIVFNDARQTLEKHAIEELVKSFIDPSIGCVSGTLVFEPSKAGTGKGIALYWDYETSIRRHEAQVHSMLGATGAIYAIRRALFPRVPNHVVLDDMFVPLMIIAKGFRAVCMETARAYDQGAEDPKEEYRRKARTLYGNFQIFALFPGLFNPFKSPIAVQLFSHKLLRVMLPFILILIFVLTAADSKDPALGVLLNLQIIFYGMALLGAFTHYYKDGWAGLVSKCCYIPYVFCLLNFSALAGSLRFISAQQDIAWEKARGIKICPP